MATLSLPNSSNLLFFLLTSLLLFSASSAFEFHVGGSKGWAEPTGNKSDTYIHWARRNRFHIGDTLYFKYTNDSVLVVDREDYRQCNTTSPIQKFSDGSTTFRFDRYGFFYFISGEPGHCRSGQRLIVRVMVHPEFVAGSPGPAPFGQQGGGLGPSSGPGHSGSSTSNGSLKANLGSSVVMAGFVGLLVVLMFV